MSKILWTKQRLDAGRTLFQLVEGWSYCVVYTIFGVSVWMIVSKARFLAACDSVKNMYNFEGEIRTYTKYGKAIFPCFRASRLVCVEYRCETVKKRRMLFVKRYVRDSLHSLRSVVQIQQMNDSSRIITTSLVYVVLESCHICA